MAFHHILHSSSSSSIEPVPVQQTPITVARPDSLDFELKRPSFEKPTILRRDSSSSSSSTSSVEKIAELVKEAPKEIKVEAPKVLERKDSTSSSSRDGFQNSEVL